MDSTGGSQTSLERCGAFPDFERVFRGESYEGASADKLLGAIEAYFTAHKFYHIAGDTTSASASLVKCGKILCGGLSSGGGGVVVGEVARVVGQISDGSEKTSLGLETPGVDCGTSSVVGGSSLGDGSVSVGQPDGTFVSEKTLANRASRIKAKARKQRKKQRQAGGVVNSAPVTRSFFQTCDDDVKKNLVKSRAKRLIRENELKELEAERKLAVLKANEVDAEVKRHRTQVLAATERNMVAIERAYGMLAATGNMTDENASRVRTVVSGTPTLSSGSISPNSSVSEAEVRKMQKDILDSEARVKQLEAMLRNVGVSPHPLTHAQAAKSVWTENTENFNLLDAAYPEGYVVDKIGMEDTDKFRPIIY